LLALSYSLSNFLFYLFMYLQQPIYYDAVGNETLVPGAKGVWDLSTYSSLLFSYSNVSCGFFIYHIFIYTFLFIFFSLKICLGSRNSRLLLAQETQLS
jgi:hypothetical protein